MPLVLDNTAFVNLAMESLVEHLTLKLRTEQDDNAKAGLIKTGRLQDDPTNRKINIMIREGGEEFPDILDTPQFGEGKTFEIGGLGGAFWRRRAILEFQLFYTNETSIDTARKKSHVVAQRAHHAICTMPRAAIPRDDYGESCYRIVVSKQWLTPGGGEGDFNYRGVMYVEFLTEIEYRESLV